MPPRFHVALPLQPDQLIGLPAAVARHVQVLRLQPDDALRLFDGTGGEWSARIVKMGRSEVDVKIGPALPSLPELGCAVTLAIGVPANERMDSLVEKATELGVAAVQPLLCERSVLRLQGERALKKIAHWQAVAVAASEQSGRARVPLVAPMLGLQGWLAALPAPNAGETSQDWRGVLSLRDAGAIREVLPAGALPRRVSLLSGPEGGLSEAEEAAARASGFVPLSLGPRVLRADTAPLAALSWIALTESAGT